MTSINDNSKRKRGRPVSTGTGHTIGVRLLPDALAALDAWIADQPAPRPTRPQAIRQLTDAGMMATKLWKDWYGVPMAAGDAMAATELASQEPGDRAGFISKPGDVDVEVFFECEAMATAAELTFGNGTPLKARAKSRTRK